MSCSVYLFIIIFMLNVQYHKFSYTFHAINSSVSSATHDFVLRDAFLNPETIITKFRSDIKIDKDTEELIYYTRALDQVKTKTIDDYNDYKGKFQELIQDQRNRKKRSRRQRIRTHQRKLPRKQTTIKETYVTDVDNSTREARQILKANILELFDLKPTTASDNVENDPYMFNDIDAYDTNDAYKKNKLKDYGKAVIQSPDFPKKRKRTEVLNDIEDNLGVDYYSDQKHFHSKATESNEEPSVLAPNEPRAPEHTVPMEATANIYYEDTSPCKQDTWQTIALRYMKGASGIRTRRTWTFNLKKQNTRTADLALVHRLLRGYENDQVTPYEHSLFSKIIDSNRDSKSFRKSKKIKINDDGSVQYDTDAKDENVIQVTEVKEYETVMGPVPAPEIEIHTMPMPTAVTYHKYKETSAPLSRTEALSSTTFTERVWVYSLQKYATRPHGAITNTYLITDLIPDSATTAEPAQVDTSPEPTLYTYVAYESKTTHEVEKPVSADKKNVAKGGKGSGNDWLYDVNDPDQIAYEMKVTEEDTDDSDIRVYVRATQQTNIQRRWTHEENTQQHIRLPVRNSAVSLHAVKTWDCFKKYITTRGFIESIFIILRVSSVDTLVNNGPTNIEKTDPFIEMAEVFDVNEGNRLAPSFRISSQENCLSSNAFQRIKEDKRNEDKAKTRNSNTCLHS